MNWKKFKVMPDKEKRNEAHYIVGLDLGCDSSGIAYYNMSTAAPEAIDLSGGYGKPSIPTVMQYIAESKEWAFGEYAVLNRGAGTEFTLGNLVAQLGNFNYIDVDKRSLSVTSVLALFIKEILGNVRHINPKAEIVGIVATVPAYFSTQAQDELMRSFKLAGYEKELIALVPDRECALARYYNSAPAQAHQVLLIDFGARELRGGLYQATTDGNITCLSSLFDNNVGAAKIDDEIVSFFEDFVLKESSKEKPLLPAQVHHIKESVIAFSYQHRDILFQKGIQEKPVKMYFNFCYPPFQQIVTHADVSRLMRPYINKFENFIHDVLAKNIGRGNISLSDIDAVICVGGGFERQWTRLSLANIFSPHQLNFFKNAKMAICEGACIVAARYLGLPEAGTNLSLIDTHQLNYDIGIFSNSEFIPLAERNAFWWQQHTPRLVLVHKEIKESLELCIAKRTQTGDIEELTIFNLGNLPARPKGATRLEFVINFDSDTSAKLHVQDCGFGDLFPRSDYHQEFNIAL